MSKPNVRTTTHATVTVQIKVSVGSWGPDCQLDQVYRQASESAINQVRKAMPGIAVTVKSVDAVTTSLQLGVSNGRN